VVKWTKIHSISNDTSKVQLQFQLASASRRGNSLWKTLYVRRSQLKKLEFGQKKQKKLILIKDDNQMRLYVCQVLPTMILSCLPKNNMI
jgi:hypothetical protein